MYEKLHSTYHGKQYGPIINPKLRINLIHSQRLQTAKFFHTQIVLARAIVPVICIFNPDATFLFVLLSSRPFCATIFYLNLKLQASFIHSLITLIFIAVHASYIHWCTSFNNQFKRFTSLDIRSILFFLAQSQLHFLSYHPFQY